MKKLALFAPIFGMLCSCHPAHGERFSQMTASDNKVVITDSVTSLCWTYDYYNNTSQQAAMAFCEALHYGGYSDWRLPDTHELAGLIHYNRYAWNAAIHNPATEWLWATSSYPYLTFYAWRVSFSFGLVFLNLDKDQGYATRCVRP